jgi:hypothetical protein
MDWDRSRNWVIKVHEVGQARVQLRFDAPVSVRDMVTIRRVFPELARATPAEIRAKVSDSGEFEVGEYPYLEASGLSWQASEAGLTVVLTNTSYVATTILEQDEHVMLLIEDESEQARIVQEMVAAGVKVIHTTSD